MKRVMKHALSLVLAGALMLGALSGCGRNPDEPPQGPDAPETPEAAETVVTDLKVNGLANPLGVEDDVPLFGWRMESDRTGAAQTACQITVTGPEGTVVWDSGKVENAASQNIAYGGEELKPQTRYTWNLAVTDEAGAELPPQEAFFETSLMDGSYAAWSGAQWIGSDEMYFDAATANYFENGGNKL